MTLHALIFFLVAGAILGGALATMAFRNLVHSALSLAVSLLGLAAAFLLLHAQFVGLAQVLVYVGAVAILIVFAILLTRGRETAGQTLFSPGLLLGAGIALLVFSVLAKVILTSRLLSAETPPAPSATAPEIGQRLMTEYVLPLEVVGLVLTVALIGAALLALREKPSAPPPVNPGHS